MGIEGAVHAMSDLFDGSLFIDSVDEWDVLLVDSFNAFSSLNHTASCCMLVFCGLAVLIFFLILVLAGQCLSYKKLFDSLIGEYDIFNSMPSFVLRIRTFQPD